MSNVDAGTFKLALVQMRVIGGARDENLNHAERLVQQAAAAGASVVVLPETMDLGWTHPSARTLAEEVPGGVVCQTLMTIARSAGVYLCSGLTERQAGKIFNAAVLISPEGELLVHHRKLNELDFAHDLYSLGDRLQVAQTPLGTMGVMICADGFARGQAIARTLGYMGASLILSPSAWAVPEDHNNFTHPYGQLWIDNYTPVARDFRMWIAGVSNVGWLTDGPWSGRPCIGCSLVVDHRGQIAVRGPYGPEAEAILYTDVKLSPRPARGDQWEQLWSAGRSLK